MLAADASLVIFLMWLSFWVRLETFLPLASAEYAVSTAILFATLLYLTPLMFVGCYQGPFLRLNRVVVIWLAPILSVSTSIFFITITLVSIDGIPRSIGLIFPSLYLSGFFLLRALITIIDHRLSDPRLVVIYGPEYKWAFLNFAYRNNYRIVGLIDDDRSISGREFGIPIEPFDRGKQLIERTGADLVLLAPDQSAESHDSLISSALSFGRKLQITPSIDSLINREVSEITPIDVDLDALLQRSPVVKILESARGQLAGAIVLVTGAGGSIGTGLCDCLLSLPLRRLVMLDHSEEALFHLRRRLNTKNNAAKFSNFEFVLGSVQDEEALDSVFLQFNPTVVIHAAAYKHVSLVEENILASIRNNVLGTKNVLSKSIEYGVARFTLVSSDKAVRPTNVMGATKRVCELLVDHLSNGKPHYVTVRFGNVIGSSGSVIPIFKKQIEAGEQISVTHPEVARFFMTIQEAATLIINATAVSDFGKTFILEMGEPIKIVVIAEKLFSLLRPQLALTQKAPIKFIGLQPGEKLIEELSISNKVRVSTVPKVLIEETDSLADNPFLSSYLDSLLLSLKTNQEQQALADLVKLLPEEERTKELIRDANGISTE
jgi:FlaA1/EpsC-like NDP-sugar epimerase